MTFFLSHFFSLLRKKKIPRFAHEEKTQQQTSEKEKKRQNKQTTSSSSSQDGNTLHPFWRIHIHSQEKQRALVLLLQIRCFFQEEILETINNKHRVVSFEPLRDSNTNKRIKEERRWDSIVRIHGQAP